MLVQINFADYERVIAVSNSGSLGHLSAQSGLSLKDIRQAIDLNVTSTIAFNSKCLAAVKDTQIQLRLVNVSSLCAIQPFKFNGLYCIGKAARYVVKMCNLT